VTQCDVTESVTLSDRYRGVTVRSCDKKDWDTKGVCDPIKSSFRASSTVYPMTFGSGKQLFPGLTATGIKSVRGALPVEIIDSLHFKL